MDCETPLSELTRDALAFRDARNWAQFHNLKDLAAALSIETGELQELFLWKDGPSIDNLMKDERWRERLSEEMADVLIFLLYLADGSQIDLADAVRRKLAKNEIKYPVNRSYDNSAKYTELQD